MQEEKKNHCCHIGSQNRDGQKQNRRQRNYLVSLTCPSEVSKMLPRMALSSPTCGEVATSVPGIERNDCVKYHIYT